LALATKPDRPRPAKTPSTRRAGRLIGYARISTEAQGTDPQADELHAAGCELVLEEQASGADRSRPVLARLLQAIRPGETLVVVRLDRLARSVSHSRAAMFMGFMPGVGQLASTLSGCT
jgi:predicted site-specific integrase-resolvase